jgi:hypothetical protein
MTFTYADIEHPECIGLKVFTSFCHDFDQCRGMCDTMAQLFEQSFSEKVGNLPNAQAIVDALAIAIPVSYCRAYGLGVRGKLKIVPTYTKEERDFHDTLRYFRSRHIAHSINRMEEQKVRAWLIPIGCTSPMGNITPKGISYVSVAHSILRCLTASDYQRLSFMCAKAVEWLNRIMNIECERLKGIFEQEFTIETLYSSVPEAFSLANLSKVKSGRPSVKLHTSFPEYFEES